MHYTLQTVFWPMCNVFFEIIPACAEINPAFAQIIPAFAEFIPAFAEIRGGRDELTVRRGHISHDVVTRGGRDDLTVTSQRFHRNAGVDQFGTKSAPNLR